MEKKALRYKVIEFEISDDLRPIEYEDGFLEFMKKRVPLMTERMRKEAYIGGKKIATAIEELLEIRISSPNDRKTFNL